MHQVPNVSPGLARSLRGAALPCLLAGALTLSAATVFADPVAPLNEAAAPSPTPSQATLRVGVFEKPPFALRGADGEWTGLAVALWERVATRAGLEFVYVPLASQDALPAVVSGQVDLLAGEVATSAARERMVDFSQPFISEPLVALFLEKTLFPHWIGFLGSLPRHGLLVVFGLIVGGLVIFSLLFWLTERRHQSPHFSEKPLHGLGSALWFAAVTMTTVGYGDKTPQTALGRALALAWMFFGILAISALTATVASTVAVARVDGRVDSLNDLARYRVGVQGGSLAEEVLTAAGIAAERFATPDAAVEAVKSGRISTFVADRATVNYELHQHDSLTFRTIELSTMRGHFAFAVSPRLNDLDAINVALLEILALPDWRNIELQWLGPDAE